MATDSTDLEPLASDRYTTETIGQALASLAMNGGNSIRAREQLLAAGIDVPARTLVYWKADRYPERYRQACDEVAPQVEAAIVGLQRDLAVQASSAAQQAVALELQRIDKGEVKDASASARNLQTTAGIAVDKVLSLTGRPTVIHGDKTGDALLKELRGLAPGLIVNSTAEEIETPALNAAEDVDDNAASA